MKLQSVARGGAGRRRAAKRRVKGRLDKEEAAAVVVQSACRRWFHRDGLHHALQLYEAELDKKVTEQLAAIDLQVHFPIFSFPIFSLSLSIYISVCISVYVQCDFFR